MVRFPAGGLAAGGAAAKPLPPVALAGLGGLPGMAAAFAIEPTHSLSVRRAAPGLRLAGTNTSILVLAAPLILAACCPSSGALRRTPADLEFGSPLQALLGGERPFAANFAAEIGENVRGPAASRGGRALFTHMQLPRFGTSTACREAGSPLLKTTRPQPELEQPARRRRAARL